MEERELILRHLKQMAVSVVTQFGKNCEACIHDLQDLQHSLVFIHGSVTGRAVGAPATDLLARALSEPSADLEDRHNYRTVSGDGRVLKSSTVFIRNSTGEPIFAFCINFDTTDFFNATQSLAPFLANEPNGAEQGNLAETFAHFPAETIDALFQQAVEEIGKQPATMSTEEKTALVEILERNGALQFKGAVEQIALLTGVSKYTIYNYLKKVHTRQIINHRT
jgi:predicted transcriptional regulator YheO